MEVGIDPLGLYIPPFAYSEVQILEHAVKAGVSLDDGKLADYIHKHTFQTVVDDIKFNDRGEWPSHAFYTFSIKVSCESAPNSVPLIIGSNCTDLTRNHSRSHASHRVAEQNRSGKFERFDKTNDVARMIAV